MTKSRFFVTTPIYYVTAAPHLGSLYSTLLADVIARWQRLRGNRTFFLTGTDEHGQKIAQAAALAKQDPQKFVDSFIPNYQEVWRQFEIDYSRFIRTTDKAHKKGVVKAVTQLLDQGDIYPSTYEGFYCTPCETFVLPKEDTKIINGKPACPSCGRETNIVFEQTYFFKLSKYQDALLKFYADHPDFIVPSERAQEVISFVQSGLSDLSITRTTVTWGIPFPADAKQVIYVWIDALLNYITGIGYGEDKEQDLFNECWPADVHVLGKDIVRFHAVYWPAILMALKLPVPRRLLVHGWIKVNKEKMSKSLGNIVDPVVLYKQYGPDPVRYYLLRQIAINQDGEFSTQDLEQKITSDLANDLGNLAQRCLSLALKHNLTSVTPPALWSTASLELQGFAANMLEEIELHSKDYAFHLMLASVWRFIHAVNSYFHAQEPWKLFKTDQAKAYEVISATLHSLKIIGIVLVPCMPNKMESLLRALGITLRDNIDYIVLLQENRWHETFAISPLETLFIKPELQETSEIVKPMEQAKTVQTQETSVQEGIININDLAKVTLQVGTITQCDRVEGSNKLLKMKVSFGLDQERQILAGVGNVFTPDDLLNKQALFVTNLAPRMMMGHESQGMMLVTKDEKGNSVLMHPARQVPDGMKLC